MTREELDFIGSMNMCDEISNEAYKKIVCHCEEQEPCDSCEHLDEINGSNCYECVKGIRDRYDPQSCEDTISRQAVLDLAKKGVLVSNDNYNSVCKAINALPSVNPTISKDRIIQLIEGHKGCQTQINLTLSKIIKEIEVM